MSTPPITFLLEQVKHGDSDAAAELMPHIYSELRRIAEACFRKERGPRTLQPSDLIQEAFIRLLGPGEAPWRDRKHFYAIAARAMRQVLVDSARSRKAKKRFGELERVDFEDNLAIDEKSPVDFVGLDAALTRLETIHPRPAQVVELRYFAGLTINETAEVMDISPSTVKKDWDVAHAWLRNELEGSV